MARNIWTFYTHNQFDSGLSDLSLEWAFACMMEEDNEWALWGCEWVLRRASAVAKVEII